MMRLRYFSINTDANISDRKREKTHPYEDTRHLPYWAALPGISLS